MGRLAYASYIGGILSNGTLDKLGFQQNHFSVQNLKYDLNGNIEMLQRNTGTLTGAEKVDHLSYTYDGNQLMAVSDHATSKGFNDGNTNRDYYSYDSNGNMGRDLKEAIASIEYNYLNLPAKVTITDGRFLEYYGIFKIRQL